jgi:predicted metalloprotease with PDZ domain
MAAQSVRGIDYRLSVDTAAPSGVTVEMRIHGAPAEFRIAMVAHTEYDDEYWRYLAGLRGEATGGRVEVTREDSALWRVRGPAGDVTLHYRIVFPVSPPLEQAAWKAHLTATGGLVGGPHSFLYIVGAEHAPVRLSVILPAAWTIVTGLHPDVTPGRFTAPGVEELTDSPLLIGLIRIWRFEVNGIPHRIALLGRPVGVAFDTALFVGRVERLARETVRMFGRTTYRDYQFLFEDGTRGGLEHRNSVTIGVKSSDLARDPDAYLGQIAHEFVHTWNEVYVRPVSWIGVRRGPPAPNGELWWSEGVTLYFADLVLRRAGLPTRDSSRIPRLERLIANYLANPSHALVSPEQTSRAFNQPPDVTGDFTPSIFTQGELLGTLLDLMIRDGSRGRRTLVDAMGGLLARFSPAHGFTGADLEHAVSGACACDAGPFFEQFVRAPGALDFDRWLATVGLRPVVTWAAARSAEGAPAPDLRVWTYQDVADSVLRLRIFFPGTLWGRADLHTGDRLDSLNGAAIHDEQQFRSALDQLHIGDTLRVAGAHGSEKMSRTMIVTGYDRPTVRLELRPDATGAERLRLAQWTSGR